MKKKTEWFPGDVEPVHIGVYNTLAFEGDGNPWFQKWDGRKWCMGNFEAEIAAYQEEESMFFPNVWKWRGLTEPAA